MDPRRMLLQRLITLIYIFIFAVGIRANWVMCTIIGSHVTTRTATDYYQLSLAISDVSLLVLGLFNELMKYWHLYPGSYGVTLCKTQAFLTEWTGYASVMTILAFTILRYLDICHPLSRYCKGGVYRAKRVILAVWVTALVAASPFAYYHSVFYYTMPPGSSAVSAVSQQWAICTMEDTPLRRLYELSSIVFFLAPGAIMFFMCVKMGLNVIPTMGATSDISMEASDGNNFASDAARQSDCRKTVLQLIAGVAVAFFMSWTLFYMQRLYYVFGTHDHKMFYEYLFVNEVYCQVTSFFNYVTATINPIIYNMHNRQAWKQAMKRVPGRVDPIYGLIGTPNDDIPDGSIAIQPAAVCGATDLGSRRPTRSDPCPLDNQITDFQTN